MPTSSRLTTTHHQRSKPPLLRAADTLQTGLAHHRAGRLSQASACYAAILATDARHADALNLTGVLARQQDDLLASEHFITQAIQVNPYSATYHHQLARTLALQHRPADATAHYRQATALNPSDIESHRLLAELLLTLGQTEEAIPLLKRILVLDPQRADIYYRLGTFYKSAGNYAAALPFYRDAVRRFPDSSDSNFNLAMALFNAGELAEAVPFLQKTIQLSPEDQEAHNILGQAFHKLMHYPAARTSYLKALNLKRDCCSTLSNLAALYVDMGDEHGDFAISEKLLRRAIEIDPAFLDAHCNLGTLYTRKGMAIEAIASFRNVLTVDSHNVFALCGLGFTLFNLGDEAAAAACYRLALDAEPTCATALFNMSSILLSEGRFAEGWAAYEMRWQLRHFASDRQLFDQPRWTGEDITGRRIYIHTEQGFGDTFQFVRYALLLAERGVTVILAVQPALAQLLRHVHPSIQVIAKGQDLLPSFDVYCPLLSLPHIFRSDLSSIPAPAQYLHPHAEDLSRWADRIDSANLRVGIVWAGNPQHTRDRIRSIPHSCLGQITRVYGVTFYSLQKGPAAADLPQVASRYPVINLDEELRDFTDTAAAIAHLDLVITVDTAVAHLAGALGKPVWILLSHASDWRWLKDRTDSPWYPTARLFRQSMLGHWDDVLASVREKLEIMVARRLIAAPPVKQYTLKV